MKLTRYLLLLAVLTVTAPAAMADAPFNYYTSAHGKTDAQLMTAMRNIINSHKQLSYSALWDAFRKTDTDAQGYIIDMYSNCKYRPDDHGGNGKNVGDGFNREHSFPKSWFDDAYPMYTDLFHLYPTDIKVNGQRSNYPFGECSGGTRLTNGQWYGKGKLGKSTFSGYSGTVFEPDDEYKGDFARTYFYMVTCYKNELPNWPGSPQLDYSTNNYKAFSTWSINLLVKWARQDPVSEKEIKRNDAVYSIQGNRNPYIDNPELFEYIWGNKQGEPWGGEVIPTDPTIISPENGSTIAMGSTTIGTELTSTVTFQGKHLKNGFTLTMSDNTNFYVSANSFSPDDVNNGTSFTVTFMALREGEFENRITLASSEVSTTFTVKATATKSGDTPPDPVLGDSIMEDWEGCTTGGYWTKEVQGNTWKWNFTDAGIWADNLSRDQLSCRMGKTSASSIAMAEDVTFDVGAISFWAGSYGSDSQAVLRVEYSTDQGRTWTAVGTVTVTTGGLERYIMGVEVEKPVRFRLVQTIGTRFNIDDITIYKLVIQPPQPNDKYDVNGDGVVNIVDVNVVIEIIFNGGGANSDMRGDVNDDNTVNIADINAIINYILTH